MKFYEEKFKELGWDKEERSMVEKEFCYANFKQEQAVFTLRGNFQRGKASCNIQGDGLLWRKNLPGPKLPVSFESWIRAHGPSPTLDFLDNYVTEMKSIQNAASN